MVLKLLYCSFSLLLISLAICHAEATAHLKLEKRIVVLFNYYKHDQTDLAQWIELLTLCLAPLVAHVVAGVPGPVSLSTKNPSWHDRLGHFNPTSIIWRYLTILDRRVRAKRWNPEQMAAVNANFWTGEQWASGEEMIWKTRCLRAPAKNRIIFFSGSATKTIIVALQGVQAIYQLVIGVVRPDTKKYADTLVFQTVFAPLSIIGLFRLPVALWLTEEYAYAISGVKRAPSKELVQEHTKEAIISQHTLDHTNTITSADLETSGHKLDKDIAQNYYPASSWRGWITPIIFLVPLFGLWGISLYYITPLNGRIYTTTNFMVNLFYLLFLSGCILIIYGCLWTARKERTRPTIIPCVSSGWYKCYTLALISLAIALVIVSALETRRTACGRYTTSRSDHDPALCPQLYKKGYYS